MLTPCLMFHRFLFAVPWQLIATMVVATCVMLDAFLVDFPVATLLQLRHV